MSLRWTRLALGDLKAIRDHISNEDRQAARRVGPRLRDAGANTDALIRRSLSPSSCCMGKARMGGGKKAAEIEF